MKNLLVCDAHEISCNALVNGRIELMVAVTGNWKSRNMKVGDKEMQEMLAAYQAGGKDILFDYDHKCLGGFLSDADSRAAGWGKAMRLENGKLFVEMEPTPRGKDAIESGEYKYLSPVFEYMRKNKVTGKTEKDWRLHSVALTNTPFLTELPAIKNTDIDGGIKMDELLKLLGASDESEALAKVNALKAENVTLTALKLENSQKLNAQEVEMAVANKQLLPAQKELATKLINADRALYDEFLAGSAAQATPLTQEQVIANADGDGLDKYAKVTSFADIMDDPKLCSEMEKDNPKRYNELHKRFVKEGK